ncbi:hypothetical protein AXG93_593s1050 [Marchantia polymorpha subsp. ruderalis]|uniref:Uncharacterized protein n=1 Tax=Marchantia polymorpha subsp. ruderalis TaxID=1480154 RepID=A0A176WPD5_MARPO|nr:hypothetical protein AXG93_593s1050 [Marchantia polymorpha subsp. ruderalis]
MGTEGVGEEKRTLQSRAGGELQCDVRGMWVQPTRTTTELARLPVKRASPTSVFPLEPANGRYSGEGSLRLELGQISAGHVGPTGADNGLRADFALSTIDYVHVVSNTSDVGRQDITGFFPDEESGTAVKNYLLRLYPWASLGGAKTQYPENEI